MSDETGLDELNRALKFWTDSLGRDAEGGLRKAARLVTMGLHNAFRVGAAGRAAKITPAAEARGFTMADEGDAKARFDRSRKSAADTLGNSKIGYFRVRQTDTGPVAIPVVLGRKGLIVRASRKNFRQRGELIDSLAKLRESRANIARKALGTRNLQSNAKAQERIRRQLAATVLPADAVPLNVQALAVVRQLKTRGRAGRGSYLAAQFLTYKKLNGAKWRRENFITKNNVEAGEVVAIPAANGGLEGIAIRGGLPGTAAVAQRIGAVDSAFRFAAGKFTGDIREKVARSFASAMGFAITRTKNRPMKGAS